MRLGAWLSSPRDCPLLSGTVRRRFGHPRRCAVRYSFIRHALADVRQSIRMLNQLIPFGVPLLGGIRRRCSDADDVNEDELRGDY